jgi:hypothetical protein
MMLEVLVSIAIMVLAIATIGGQVSLSLKTVEYTDKLNRALMLAEWVLAEMDLGMEEEDRLIDIRGEEGEGIFGERYPGFGWRIEREPTDVDNLDLITLDILHGDPEAGSVEDWDVLHTVYALRPVVAELDPSDFGMPSQEEIGLLAATAPPTGVDGSAGAGLGAGMEQMDLLLSLLPAPLQEIFQRFLGGEPVPLDEIRAAFGELTSEDLLGMVTMPGLLGMLGGDTDALFGQMLGGGAGPAGLDQALDGADVDPEDVLQGGADESVRKRLERLAPRR